jgi:hypothetical protein
VVSIVGSDRATETSLRVHLEGAAVEHHRRGKKPEDARAFVGEATEVEGGIASLRIEDIEVLTQDESALEKRLRDEAPFDTPSDLAILAREQGVGPVTDLKKLAGGFWPEDESTDDLLRSLRAWRDERPGGNPLRGSPRLSS